jgi:CheY-like chemotaxis protein
MTKSFSPKSLVLYADDDTDDIELVCEAFREYSSRIDVLTFPDGQALLHYIRQLNPFEPLPCLIILDINMPRLNGKETLRKLRQLDGFADVPVVLFSTSTLPADAGFARTHNAGFVTKPLHTEQIHQLVDQMIQHCSGETREQFRRKKGK